MTYSESRIPSIRGMSDAALEAQANIYRAYVFGETRRAKALKIIDALIGDFANSMAKVCVGL